jgi:hypothetical protein
VRPRDVTSGRRAPWTVDRAPWAVTVTGATSKPSRVGSTESRKEVQGEEVKSRIGTQWVPNPTRQSWRPPEPSLAWVRGDLDLRSVDRECVSCVTEPRNVQSECCPGRSRGQLHAAHVEPVGGLGGVNERGVRASGFSRNLRGTVTPINKTSGLGIPHNNSQDSAGGTHPAGSRAKHRVLR